MSRFHALGHLLVTAALGLAACETLPSVLAPLPPPSQLQAAEPRVSGAVPSGRERAPVVESPGVAPKPARAAPRAGESAVPGDITLNFVDADIHEIVRVILGETLHVNYTIDPTVKGTASLGIGRPLHRAELLPTLETLLNQNGATMTRRGDIYRISPLAAVSPATGAGSLGAGAQIVPLHYASATDLAKVLEPYVAPGGKITAEAGRNALIVSGDPTARQALIGMIEAFDIDALAGQSYALIPAGDGSADKLAGELEKVFQAESSGPLTGVVRVVPMQRVNAVLVVSRQQRYINEARRVLGLERRVENATTRSWHVYYVQNGQSADLENLLRRAFTPGQAGQGPTPPGVTLPGAEPLAKTSAPGGAGLSGLGQPMSAASAARGVSAASPGLTTLATPEQPKKGPAEEAAELLGGPVYRAAEAEDHIRIIANRRNNALLIYATRGEYTAIEGMLRKIDIIPLQVLIEATIAEVTLTDKLSYGTQFFLKSGKLSGTLSGAASGDTSSIATIAGIPIGYASNFPGFVAAYGIHDVINALSAVTEVKVLSAPEVMVLDSEPARLQVGNVVPVLTQTQQSTIVSNAPVVNSIDYRDTGVILLVTPQVNSGGLVTLDLSQEVSDVLSTTTGDIQSPTFDQRLIRTRVAVQDGQTVGLAGLIRDNSSESNSGIPLLKEIPLLGSLVSGQANKRERTELLVLITPHVIRNQYNARALTEDLRHELIGAGLVDQQLRAKPPSGSANPNGY